MGIFGNISKRLMKGKRDIEPQLAGMEKTPSPWQVGDIIRGDKTQGTYKVMDIKGGGMGQVYICIREEDRMPFALKTFKKEYLASKAAIERFRWEAEVWVRLGRHKNIVNAYFTDESMGYVFVIMEYVAGDEYYGSDLSGFLRKGGLSIPLALDFACQFCTGMMHAKEIFANDPSLKPPFVHRDIKPENIMVTIDRIVKVTDFGLVKAFEMLSEDIQTDVKDEFGERRHGFTKRGKVCGTLPYIAPEIWLRKELDERSDIYSFGCVLYHMFYGIPPFAYPRDVPNIYEKYENAHLNLSPKPIKDIPDEINQLILKCLKKERGERYNDFNLLRDDLAELYYNQTGEKLIFREETEDEWEAEAWLDKGLGLGNLGFHKEAIECYTRALELNPKYAKAYYNRGSAYYGLRDYERAIEDYNEAIRINPKYAEAYNNRGIAYRHLGNYERAIEDYSEAIRINPKHANAYNNRGNAYRDLGNYERAIEDYDEAIRINPKFAKPYYYNKALCLQENLKRYEEALEMWKNYLDLAKDDPQERDWIPKAKEQMEKLRKVRK